MNKFGVCYCELNQYITESVVRDLVVFDTFEEAYADYKKKVDANDNPLSIPDDLWIVWIDTELKAIIQFERFSWKTKTDFIKLKDMQ